jgi:hypothetical protein
MSDTQYFEDMWIALENELSSFDNYSPSTTNFSGSNQNQNTSPNSNLDSMNVEPQTYEQLLNQISQPEPTSEQLSSGSRQERIDAVKQLYNKQPFILYAKIEKVATSLYKAGKVKEANSLLEAVDFLIQQ